ncbi:MAG: carboxypeptidase regulatory-like domain-containing protein, partial [Candidatus Acidiferrum sp.]
MSGTLRDPSGGVVPGATITLTNAVLKSEFKATSDDQGFYSFPTLPVGHYDMTIEAAGFKTEQKTDLAVDTDASLKLDVVIELGAQSETVLVQATDTQIDTAATQLGEVVTGSQMTALPLNGRSFTDLLAIQPGIIPVTTLLPSSVIMAGVTGSLSPSGDLNPGNLSIDGQRESSNGFMVNGVDVQEHMNGGTSIVPNLDSIDEFRVLTNNFDPEYGNYNGGMVTVVTKSGSDSLHGSGFEFLRNTDLDARGYFDPTRAPFRQNQFGGTLGGPIKRQKLYFFADYQGTRTTEGVPTGLITVPSAQERSGDFLGQASSLTGKVSGTYLASLLSQKLGYAVSAGEPYYTTGCSSTSACVFPGATIPQNVWSTPATNLLNYIPAPNSGVDQFSTSAFPETVRDDKASRRVDANTHWGQLSLYYFLDNYRVDNPYPQQQGGASIPGFDALTYGQAQLITLSDAKAFGSGTVNDFHIGFLRYANVIGQPQGGLGVSLASQGFASGPTGIVVQAPQFEGVENIAFPSFVMGVPITNETQNNNTLFLSDTFSKVFSPHTLKFGGQFHWDQVNEHPNATFNGTFNITGTQTGNAFADFLLGLPSNFTQSSGEPFYLRDRYTGLFAQDSWRIRHDLIFNFGLRWEYIMPFWEKYNQLQTIIPGRQSVVYPNAPAGLVVPGDPGIPSTIAPSKPDNFAPRLGVAYSPGFDHGILNKIFGTSGNSSIRASYGMFYTAFPGLSAGIMYAVP